MMNKNGSILAGLGIAVAVFLCIGMITFSVFAGFYDQFNNESKAVEGSWAQVENVYQRRIDLIPNLVAATKGIFEQEREVFGAIAKARQHYATAENSTQKVEATNQVESSLARLLVIMENYPQLYSNQTVQGLMFVLAGTENRISVERERYNKVVQQYNTDISSFMGRFFAALYGFKDKPFFKTVTAGAEIAPVINLSLKN
jgi:LemA protein